MSSPKIGRLSKGEGKKVSMLSNDRLLKEIKSGIRSKDTPKCIRELMKRGLSKEEINMRVAAL